MPRRREKTDQELLYLKLKRGASWKDFLGYNNQYTKHHFQRLMKDLIPSNLDCTIYTSPSDEAAYLKFRTALNLYLMFYRSKTIEDVEDIVLKLWWDERKIVGKLQMVVGLSCISPSLPSHHSWINLLPFILHNQGCPETLEDLFALSDLAQWVRHYENSDVAIHSEDKPSKVKFVMVMDWNCYYLLDPACVSAKSTTFHQKLCPCCSFSTNDKLETWKLDPWKFWRRDATDTYFFETVGTCRKCLYDPMHGIARLTTNALEGLKQYLRSIGATRLISKLGDCIPNFASKNFNMSIGDTKEFLNNSNVSTQLQRIIQDSGLNPFIGVKLHDETVEYLSLMQIVIQLRDSLAFYFKFIYAKEISEECIQTLRTHRDKLLSFFNLFDFVLNPTVHYMTSHFFEDIDYMSPVVPRNWLCEGEEAANAHNRRMSNATTKDARAMQNSMTLCQQMLYHCLLLHLLRLHNPDLD